MKVCAVIAEFNPFHNGHAYLINKMRSAGYTHIVVLMSGNFVQRGEPAIVSKELRASMALKNGADLVLELPTVKVVATAEKYAFSAVNMVECLGCVDALAFGSESGDLNVLDQIKTSMYNDRFHLILKKHLDKGITFATARENAMSEILRDSHIASQIKTPNNILGVEYLKAIEILGLNIKCLTFKRAENSDMVASASFIRDLIIRRDYSYRNYIPQDSYTAFDTAVKIGIAPVEMYSSDRVILSKLRSLTLQNISELPDISEGLENRIYNSINESCCLEELLSRIKTKRYTMSRIRRIILCAFLGITSEIAQNPVEYIKVLATNSKGLEILKVAKSSARLPILTRYNDVLKLDKKAYDFFEYESKFTDLYNTLTPNILPCGIEKKFKLIKG